MNRVHLFSKGRHLAVQGTLLVYAREHFCQWPISGFLADDGWRVAVCCSTVYFGLQLYVQALCTSATATVIQSTAT
jgi:hypothetical protein